MTLEEFVNLFDGTQVPIAFDHFKTPQKLPYMVYTIISNNNMPADDKVYYTTPQIQLELYSVSKNMALETTVENVLDGFFYEKDEGYLFDEQMYMVTYQFTLR